MAELLGIQLHRTTAYHPQANGLVERFHRHMKGSLRARLTGPNWIDELSWVMFGIRTAPKDDLSASSAGLVYGAPITVPADFVDTSGSAVTPNQLLQRLRDIVGSLAPVPISRHGTRAGIFVPTGLLSAPYVFIRRGGYTTPLQAFYTGPFRVIQHGPKTFRLDVGGRAEDISIDRLKPAHVDGSVQLAQPPRRGRPPHLLASSAVLGGGGACSGCTRRGNKQIHSLPFCPVKRITRSKNSLKQVFYRSLLKSRRDSLYYSIYDARAPRANYKKRVMHAHIRRNRLFCTDAQEDLKRKLCTILI
jgi:hypothetical protein